MLGRPHLLDDRVDLGMLHDEGQGDHQDQGHRQHHLRRALRVVRDEHPVDDHQHDHREDTVLHGRDRARHVVVAEEIEVDDDTG